MKRAMTYLRLGRVSNLPTVWTDVLAGVVLAGGVGWATTTLALAVTLSLFYVGGMFLNDVFDRRIDARERPERPIPSGKIGVGEVLAVGLALLGVGVALCAALGGLGCAVGGALLAALIIVYDAWHKGNPVGPVIMGSCRVMVYVIAAVSVTPTPQWRLWAGAAALLGYLIGLTYVAKHENHGLLARTWPLASLAAPLVLIGGDLGQPAVGLFALALLLWMLRCVRVLRSRRPGCIPRAVIGLIAGISLVDALAIASAGAPGLALVAALGFLATLALQRWVRGT